MSIDTGLYIESIILSLYLIFIFLSIQIWFLWKDIDKNELKTELFFTDSFFTKNCIYVYSFSVFFIINVLSDRFATTSSYLEVLGLLALISLVVFTYDWYGKLNNCVSKKSLPQELIDIRSISKRSR